MILKVDYLVKRRTKTGERIYQYRREVPAPLRLINGKREIKQRLDSGNEIEAQRRWVEVHQRAEAILKEAEAGRKSPAVAAYNRVKAHKFGVEQAEEGLDYYLTDLLEANNLTPAERAAIEGLLNRRELQAQGDNPPLSLVLERYFIDKKTTVKMRLEWEGVLKRFTVAVGGVDLPVRSITSAHVRDFKKALQATPSSRCEGEMLSAGTIQKQLNALKAVLSWARSEDYITSNPAERITVAKANHNDDSGRLPYDAADLGKYSHMKPSRRERKLSARDDQPIIGCRTLGYSQVRVWRS